MATLTTYTKGKLHDLVLRATAYTAPATVYLALFSNATSDTGTGTEISGSSYARQAITFVALDASFIGKNAAQVQFPAVTTTGYTAVDWAIYDASTAGNMLMHGPFLDPVILAVGQRFTVQVSELGIAWG